MTVPHYARTSRRSRCFILFELSLVTLPVLLMATVLCGTVRYARCSPRVKRYFQALVKRTGAAQISEHDYFSQSFLPQCHEAGIRAGKSKGARNAYLQHAFVEYGRSPRYAELVDQAFVQGWSHIMFSASLVARFMAEASGGVERIYFFSGTARRVFEWPEDLPDTVRFLRPHQFFCLAKGFVARLGFLVVLLIFPFLNSARLLAKGLRPARDGGQSGRERKDYLFVHRGQGLNANKARDLYLFHEGILDYGDCTHFLMTTSQNFTGRKVQEIEGGGGSVVAVRDLEITFDQFVSNIFVRYYRAFFIPSLRLLGSPDVNLATLKQLLEMLHLMPLASAMLDTVSPKIVYLETETAPFTNITAVEAHKRGVRSVTMVHGAAAQKFPLTSRANLQYDVYLTPGRDNAVVRTISPGIGRVVAVGNHEVDQMADETANDTESLLPDWVRRERGRYKVIGCFLVMFNNFTDARSYHSKTEHLDEDRCREHARRHLGPLFDWIAADDELIFVWKPKIADTSQNADHPWIAPLLAAIPKERVIVLPQATIGQVLKISDVCIGTGGSSAISCAMAMGRPISVLDLYLGGWTRKYHPWMAARTGEELVRNLENLLRHGLPREVFDAFNADWYADGMVDGGTPARIRALLESLLTVQPLPGGRADEPGAPDTQRIRTQG